MIVISLTPSIESLHNTEVAVGEVTLWPEPLCTHVNYCRACISIGQTIVLA